MPERDSFGRLKPPPLVAVVRDDRLVCPIAGHDQDNLRRRGSQWYCPEGHMLLSPSDG